MYFTFRIFDGESFPEEDVTEQSNGPYTSLTDRYVVHGTIYGYQLDKIFYDE